MSATYIVHERSEAASELLRLQEGTYLAKFPGRKAASTCRKSPTTGAGGKAFVRLLAIQPRQAAPPDVLAVKPGDAIVLDEL